MREKTFGYGKLIPLDRNQKIRIKTAARAYNALHRTARQHKGPLTRTTLEVLDTLLWGFHNAASGLCFPSYEAIAAKAQCHRDSVHEAIRALEAAGILTWCHRIGRAGARILRRSNSYRFTASEIPSGTRTQEVSSLSYAQREDQKARESVAQQIAVLTSGSIEAALARLGAVLGVASQ